MKYLLPGTRIYIYVHWLRLFRADGLERRGDNKQKLYEVNKCDIAIKTKESSYERLRLGRRLVKLLPLTLAQRTKAFTNDGDGGGTWVVGRGFESHDPTMK